MGIKLKKLLISQPEMTPAYKRLTTEYQLDLTFFKFFDIVGYTASEFRKTRIHLNEYTAVIFISKHAVDNFFRLAKELRVPIPETMKYFCSTEQVAYYLRNYIQYRKRKIFYGEHHFADVVDIMTKHREEKFLLPCSDERQTEYTKMLDKAKFKYMKAPMYKNVPKDLTHFKLSDFDMIVLFSPIGVRSLLQSFPNVKDEPIAIAAFGTSTHAALNAAGIKLTVAAPTKSSPSMASALENYILGKQQEAVVVAKPNSMKNSKSVHNAKVVGAKKPKSVFASKTKYKQLMEEKKAKAAAKRAERAAEKARKEAAATKPATTTGHTTTTKTAAKSTAKSTAKRQ